MRNQLLRSTGFQLSLRYALIYSLLTACVFIAAYFFARGELRDWVEEDVRSELAELRALAESQGRAALIEEISLEIREASDRGTWIFQLTDAQGVSLAGNARSIPTFDTRLVISRDAIESDGQLDKDAIEFITRDTFIGDMRLVIGRSSHLMREAVEIITKVMAAGLVLLLLTGLGFGFLVGRRTEQRIRTIRRTLADIAEGDLTRRVPLDAKNDDLRRVSEAINGALARLQALVESQHQISADIAHDLKTPIQRLRQRLERASPEDAKTALVIEESIADADSIILTFQALLRIAQIEGGARRARFQPVDLTEICKTVASAFEAVAEDEGHRFDFVFPKTSMPVHGDRELLTQLAANLVENAIRHCPEPATITLRVFVEDDSPQIEIADTGPGIPEDERERVLRRLYRLEKSRTTSGNGLGLSMVKAIAELHDARLRLDDNAPGLRVTIAFSKNDQ